MGKQLISRIFFCICLAGTACIASAGTGCESCFQRGQLYQGRGEYGAAIEAFQAAVQSDPDNALYHLWLARGYGKLARQSEWTRAMSLATKTRRELEVAVVLDGENLDALTDLRDYYAEAPGFLGGSQEKAQQLDEEISRLNRVSN